MVKLIETQVLWGTTYRKRYYTDGKRVSEAECNYPERNKRHSPNAYLAEVASELIEEALNAARAKIAALCKVA